MQALYKHTRVPPLHAPGDSDVTWLIDFDRVRHLLAPRTATYLSGQGTFLAAMGIGPRAQSLAKATPQDADTIADALERLTAPDRMGTLFKVLAAVSPGLPPPPGFEAPR